MTRFVERAGAAGLMASVLLLVALVVRIVPTAAQEGIALPPPAVDLPASQAASEVMVIAGGCFWGVQGVFQHVKGVSNALSGYAGGAKSTAIYEVTNSGTTATSSWTVVLTFANGQRITQIWNATAPVPASSPVTANNAPYNNIIAAGGNTSFGFIGSRTLNGTNNPPTLTCSRTP